MKRARQYPFDQIRRKRLLLTIKNSSHLAIPSEKRFFRWIFEAMSTEYAYASIGLLLCGLSDASYYNKYYRAKDYATNVLSFPLNLTTEPNCLRGDLIICPEVVVKEAREQCKMLESHYAHLVVHGVLHLMGYDHIAQKDAQLMESREINILHSMGYQNPY